MAWWKKRKTQWYVQRPLDTLGPRRIEDLGERGERKLPKSRRRSLLDGCIYLVALIVVVAGVMWVAWNFAPALWSYLERLSQHL